LDKFVDEVQSAAVELKTDYRPVGRYLLETEAHVYAFAIAANVLLAFYPFMLVMIALCRHVFHWPGAEQAIYVAIKDYFSGRTGEFIAYNLGVSASYTRQLEWVSVLLLLFTANGVFLPLEVALNRAWGVTVNRSLLKNQLISMGLIFACGALALLSAMLTAGGLVLAGGLQDSYSTVFNWVVRMLFKALSIPITVAILFLVFCFLPNTKVPKKAVLPRTVVIALLLEALKWINLAIWPWLYKKFEREYGVFVNSVTILTWSFLAGLVVLAGADWTARRARAQVIAEVTGPPLLAPNQDRIGADSNPTL
jgi:YihY family inner membrane protein